MWLVDDVSHGCENIQVVIWRSSCEKLYDRTAQAPNITCRSYGLFLDNLRGHPVASASERHVLTLQRAVVILLEHHRHTEVSQLYLAIFIGQNIPAFYIAVDNTLRVQIL